MKKTVPPREGFRIDHIYAFLSVADDGDEGLTATRVQGTWMPLIAADEARLADLRHMAQQIATEQGQAIRLVRFTERVEMGRIEP